MARSIGILYELKYVLPKDTLLQLYHSLVHSYFIYGLTVWAMHSQVIFLNYIGYKTKPLQLLVEVVGMKLLLLSILL